MTAASSLPFPFILTPQSGTYHSEFIASSTAANRSRTCAGFLRPHFRVVPFLLSTVPFSPQDYYAHRPMSSQLGLKTQTADPTGSLSSLQAIPIPWGCAELSA